MAPHWTLTACKTVWVLCLLGLPGRAAEPQPMPRLADLARAPIDYSRQIRPILANNCFRCHGPDTSQRRSGLRLDIRDGALQPAKSGQSAIVPGKPTESML